MMFAVSRTKTGSVGSLLCLVIPALVLPIASASFVQAATLLVEAEGFDDRGGWVVDQQAMDEMGSPYLLAHGLGRPVRDARTTISVPEPGEYRVLVQSALDRHRAQQYGTHEVKVTVARRSVAGEAGLKDMVMDEKVNRWHVAESEIGTLKIDTAGDVALSLRAVRVDKRAAAGVTVVGVRLVQA